MCTTQATFSVDGLWAGDRGRDLRSSNPQTLPRPMTPTLTTWLAVFLGGGLGSVLRFAVGQGLASILSPSDTAFPWAVLAANVLATGLLAWTSVAGADAWGKSSAMWFFLTVGVCGGFSTFSTFAWDTLRLMQQGGLGLALAQHGHFCGGASSPHGGSPSRARLPDGILTGPDGSRLSWAHDEHSPPHRMPARGGMHGPNRRPNPTQDTQARPKLVVGSPWTKCVPTTSPASGRGTTSTRPRRSERAASDAWSRKDLRVGTTTLATPPPTRGLATPPSTRERPRRARHCRQQLVRPRRKESVYCASDTSVRGVSNDGLDGDGSVLGGSGKMSPARLLSTTLGDELKVATGGAAKVFGMSMKDRGAILPAGHAADGAFGFTARTEVSSFRATTTARLCPTGCKTSTTKGVPKR